MIGRVAAFNPARYGFITIEGGQQFFFHRNDMIGEVWRGDEVEFWIDEGRDGRLIAVEVQQCGGRA